MRLCLTLGYPSLRVMWRHMTRAEFLDWWALDQIEPIGDTRSDYQAASICAAMMNGLAALARSKKKFSVETFLLKWGEAAEEEKPAGVPWQQMKLVARMWAASAKADEASPRRQRVQRTKAVAPQKVEEVRAALLANDRRPKR